MLYVEIDTVQSWKPRDWGQVVPGFRDCKVRRDPGIAIPRHILCSEKHTMINRR